MKLHAFADVFAGRRHKRLLTSLLFLAAVMPAAAQAVMPGQGKSTQAAELIDSNSLLGSYLAGRVARSSRDNEVAAVYFQRALAKDPANQSILDDAFQLELAAGNFDAAKRLALTIVKRRSDNATAYLFLGLDAFRRKQYTRADEYFRIAERGAAGEPTLKLARAWVAVAQGRPSKALAILNSPSKAAWAVQFETIQKAFMADVARQKDAAGQAFAALAEKKPLNPRVSEAFARHLAFWGDAKRAISELQGEGDRTLTPKGKELLAELQAGKKPALMVSNVDEGLSEVFLGIGQILASNNGVDAALIYLRFALLLNPSSDITKLELAEVHGSLEQYDKAIAILAAIPQSSPFWLNAQLRRALNLNSMQRADDAVATLRNVLDARPDDLQVLQTLGSIESARKNYEAAIPYYDRAIAGIQPTSDKKYWGLYYSRGIALERTKQWAKAEVDFKKALELNPDEPAVLNYLGYSWLDQGINVPEAFNYIKKAVKLRPNDGYIVDSLGWAYYIQKDYEQAVKHLDRAVELKADDATLNDHLGDCYWRLGRRLEAQFQWAQALTLNPEPEDAEKIRRKLEAGLPDEVASRASLDVKPAQAVKSDSPVNELTR